MRNLNNLKNFKCPDCEQSLHYNGVDVRCGSCYFKITWDKLGELITQKEREYQKPFLWQNLKNGQCPMCEGLVVRAVGERQWLECLNRECTFRIHEESLQKKLEDPAHPINQYQGI